jgi:hypothetical protein
MASYARRPWDESAPDRQRSPTGRGAFSLTLAAATSGFILLNHVGWYAPAFAD